MTEPARLTVDGKSYTLANQVSAHKLRELLEELGALPVVAHLDPDCDKPGQNGCRGTWLTVNNCKVETREYLGPDGRRTVEIQASRIESARRAELWPSIATAASIDGIGPSL